jgi:hypothetical protein
VSFTVAPVGWSWADAESGFILTGSENGHMRAAAQSARGNSFVRTMIHGLGRHGLCCASFLHGSWSS